MVKNLVTTIIVALAAYCILFVALVIVNGFLASGTPAELYAESSTLSVFGVVSKCVLATLLGIVCGFRLGALGIWAACGLMLVVLVIGELVQGGAFFFSIFHDESWLMRALYVLISAVAAFAASATLKKKSAK